MTETAMNDMEKRLEQRMDEGFRQVHQHMGQVVAQVDQRMDQGVRQIIDHLDRR